MRSEINYGGKNYEKQKNTWRIIDLLLNNPEVTKGINNTQRTSPVAQRLRTCLPVQGTWVWSRVWEDSTCCRATKPVRPTPGLTGRKRGAPPPNSWSLCRLHSPCASPAEPARCNCWSPRALETVLHSERSRHATAREGPAHCSLRKPTRANKDPAQP